MDASLCPGLGFGPGHAGPGGLGCRFLPILAAEVQPDQSPPAAMARGRFAAGPNWCSMGGKRGTP